MDIDNIMDMLSDGDSRNIKPLSLDSFDEMIKRFYMVCEYSITDISGEIFVVEEWTTDMRDDLKLNRVYQFTEETLLFIKLDSRKIVLEKILNKLVFEEKYENAAKLRDIISLL